MDLRKLQQAYLSQLRKVTKDKLKRGSLIRTIISQEDGLNLTDGRKEKPKLMVIIGYDESNDFYYGSVLVNTNKNPRSAYSKEYLQAQYMLKKDNYSDFLSYDSYADCGVLFPVPLEKLLLGEYFGELTESDLKGIFKILKKTETISIKIKKRFGII